jgi:hypothetical protein
MWTVRGLRLFALGKADPMDARFEMKFNRLSPRGHMADVEKSIIVVVVLLKTRRGTSRMGSDVIFPVRRADPSG